MQNVLFENIPIELRSLPNWCMWKLEDIGTDKPTKVPYQTNGFKASVNDPNTWCTFYDAINCFSLGGYNGIGFMFTNSGYTGLDLDDPEGNAVIIERQLKIYHEFDSYSELSPSGKGLHIIVKGIISAGRRREKIEMYSSGRFFTMTGNVYLNKPIAERQFLLDQLWQQIGSTQHINLAVDQPQRYSDEEVLYSALAANNGDKFAILNSPRWTEIYSSQSEADFAFIDVIAFYSRNKEQIARMFRASPLGQRKKAMRDDYVEKMITRSFDNIPLAVDFDGFKNALDLKLAAQENKTFKKEEPKKSIPLPPGLVGDIARFIYQAAPRPVEEVALAGAIALMSGICGRAYNISSMGLNQYVLLIARTGRGKEAAASGISKIVNSVRQQVPTISEFIGPSEISSGPALFKTIAQTPCFVSLLGEFGLRLQQLSNQHANGAEVSLKRMLLDLYNKSGVHAVLYKSVYSDREKNTTDIQSPSFSMFGESTPERLYGALSEDMITEGLLSRFHIIEYSGDRVKLNEHHDAIQPQFDLIEKVASLSAHCMTINHAQPRRVVNLNVAPDALVMLNKFNDKSDAKINNSNKEAITELWNRAHVKALKLAGLIAVGCNFAAPIVQVEHVVWAINLIENDIENLTSKFEAGVIGINSAELVQQKETSRIIKEYYVDGLERALKYGATHKLYGKSILPYAYIGRRLNPLTVFKNDKISSAVAIQRSLKSLLDSGKIRELDKIEVKNAGVSSQRLFMIVDMDMLN